MLNSFELHNLFLVNVAQCVDRRGISFKRHGYDAQTHDLPDIEFLHHFHFLYIIWKGELLNKKEGVLKKIN